MTPGEGLHPLQHNMHADLHVAHSTVDLLERDNTQLKAAEEQQCGVQCMGALARPPHYCCTQKHAQEAQLVNGDHIGPGEWVATSHTTLQWNPSIADPLGPSCLSF